MALPAPVKEIKKKFLPMKKKQLASCTVVTG